MLLKKFLYTWRNKLLLLIQNIMPVFFVVVTILIIKTQGTFQELKPITFSLTQYPVAVTVLDRYEAVNDSPIYKYSQAYEVLSKSYGNDFGLEVTENQNFTVGFGLKWTSGQTDRRIGGQADTWTSYFNL